MKLVKAHACMCAGFKCYLWPLPYLALTRRRGAAACGGTRRVHGGGRAGGACRGRARYRCGGSEHSGGGCARRGRPLRRRAAAPPAARRRRRARVCPPSPSLTTSPALTYKSSSKRLFRRFSAWACHHSGRRRRLRGPLRPADAGLCSGHPGCGALPLAPSSCSATVLGSRYVFSHVPAVNL